LNPSGAVPDARYGGAMVYDSSTGKVIMFGGSGANGPLNDIWAYDPTANTWTNLNPSGTLPKARDATALVSDASTNKLIMFGGVGMSGQLNDTWAYDPTANTWTDLQPSGTVPDARAGQSMAYDPSTGKVIMFGGFGSASLNDTWAYDPGANTWTDLKPSGTLPPARNNFSLSYEASLDQVVAFGGFSDSNYLSDTWAYDPSANTWTDLNPSGTLPDARDGGSMAYDPTSQKVILFGGYDGTNYLNDTWAYSS
jgi:N-acetylneuraminic acid mutarotase